MSDECQRCRQLEAQVHELTATVRRLNEHITQLQSLIHALLGRIRGALDLLVRELEDKPTMNRLDLLKHLRARLADAIDVATRR